MSEQHILILAAAFVLVLVFILWARRSKKFDELPISSTQLPESQFCQVGDFRVHYVQKGRGPHLVLIHGLGASLYCWRLIIDELSENFTVTALDLPGFGKSTKIPSENYGLDDQTKRVIEFLKKLGVKQCRVVGNSMGGAIALWMAKTQPDFVLEVSVQAPAISPRLIPVDAKKFAGLAKALRYGLSARTIRNIMKRVVANPQMITEESVQTYAAPYLGNDQAIAVFLKATELIRDPRLPKDLAKIKTPVQILYGLKDQVVPHHHMLLLKDLLPHCQYLENELAGHHIMEDDPDWTVLCLNQFFNIVEI